MGMEEYFTKAIELYKGLERKTDSSRKEMREIYYCYQTAKDYGEINTPTQIKLDRLFYDIKKEIFK